MRYPVRYLALGAALAATPALAQLGVNLGGQAGAGLNVGGVVNPGAAVGGVTGSLDRTVNHVDHAVDGTINGALDGDLRVATAADLQSGAVVRDKHGHSIGVVQSVDGNAALVARNGRQVHVPLAALYRSSSGLMTSLTKTQVNAMFAASANAGASASAHN
jgi:hypothetical protein